VTEDVNTSSVRSDLERNKFVAFVIASRAASREVHFHRATSTMRLRAYKPVLDSNALRHQIRRGAPSDARPYDGDSVARAAFCSDLGRGHCCWRGG
jgi:hypothetical protein